MRAALIFVVAIPLLSIVVFGILLISMPLYKKVQKQLDRVLLTTRENLLGARVVRAFNRQQDEMKKSDEENSLLVKFPGFCNGKISALMNPVTYVIVQWRDYHSDLDWCMAGRRRHHHPGCGCGSGKLYVPDSG